MDSHISDSVPCSSLQRPILAAALPLSHTIGQHQDNPVNITSQINPVIPANGYSINKAGITETITCGPMNSTYHVPPRPKPGRKTVTEAPPTKRKQQNREAQRLFRARRQRLREQLESEAAATRREKEELTRLLLVYQHQLAQQEIALQSLRQRCAVAEASTLHRSGDVIGSKSLTIQNGDNCTNTPRSTASLRSAKTSSSSIAADLGLSVSPSSFTNLPSESDCLNQLALSNNSPGSVPCKASSFNAPLPNMIARDHSFNLPTDNTPRISSSVNSCEPRSSFSSITNSPPNSSSSSTNSSSPSPFPGYAGNTLPSGLVYPCNRTLNSTLLNDKHHVRGNNLTRSVSPSNPTTGDSSTFSLLEMRGNCTHNGCTCAGQITSTSWSTPPLPAVSSVVSDKLLPVKEYASGSPPDYLDSETWIESQTSASLSTSPVTLTSDSILTSSVTSSNVPALPLNSFSSSSSSSSSTSLSTSTCGGQVCQVTNCCSIPSKSVSNHDLSDVTSTISSIVTTNLNTDKISHSVIVADNEFQLNKFDFHNFPKPKFQNSETDLSSTLSISQQMDVGLCGFCTDDKNCVCRKAKDFSIEFSAPSSNENSATLNSTSMVPFVQKRLPADDAYLLNNILDNPSRINPRSWNTSSTRMVTSVKATSKTSSAPFKRQPGTCAQCLVNPDQKRFCEELSRGRDQNRRFSFNFNNTNFDDDSSNFFELEIVSANFPVTGKPLSASCGVVNPVHSNVQLNLEEITSDCDSDLINDKFTYGNPITSLVSSPRKTLSCAEAYHLSRQPKMVMASRTRNFAEMYRVYLEMMGPQRRSNPCKILTNDNSLSLTPFTEPFNPNHQPDSSGSSSESSLSSSPSSSISSLSSSSSSPMHTYRFTAYEIDVGEALAVMAALSGRDFNS